MRANPTTSCNTQTRLYSRVPRKLKPLLVHTQGVLIAPGQHQRRRPAAAPVPSLQHAHIQLTAPAPSTQHQQPAPSSTGPVQQPSRHHTRSQLTACLARVSCQTCPAGVSRPGYLKSKPAHGGLTAPQHPAASAHSTNTSTVSPPHAQPAHSTGTQHPAPTISTQRPQHRHHPAPAPAPCLDSAHSKVMKPIAVAIWGIRSKQDAESMAAKAGCNSENNVWNACHVTSRFACASIPLLRLALWVLFLNVYMGCHVVLSHEYWADDKTL